MNMKIVITDTNQIGTINGSFGKTGKFKVKFNEELQNAEELKNKTLYMPFKKLLFDNTHKMVQDI